MSLLINRALIRNLANIQGITITTNQTTLTAVGILLVFASGTIKVSWGDGTAIETFTSNAELTHNYSVTGTYTIIIFGDLANITRFDIDSSKVTLIENFVSGLMTNFDIQSNLYNGNLDLSSAPVGGTFTAQTNTSLAITFATSGNSIITFFTIFSSGYSGVLDLSNVPIGSIFGAHLNPNLTGLLISSSGNTKMTNFTVYSCNLTGVLDFSNLPISGIFRFESNLLLTGITHSTTGNTITTTYNLSNCNIIGTHNLANVPIGGIFNIYNNPLLTGITFSASGNGLITNFNLYSCSLGYVDFTNFSFANNNGILRLDSNGMPVDVVNHILVDLYSLVSGEGVGGDYTGRIINISGTNAAPDGSSGGFDGLTAKTNLEGKGFTVATS